MYLNLVVFVIFIWILGFTKSSGIQWPFSNKVSAVPQLMTFNFAQGDKTKKIGSDSLVSPGFMPISTADAAEVQVWHHPLSLLFWTSCLMTISIES